MIRRLVCLIALSLLVPALVSAQVHVDGHVRRDGTYVPPHYRSAPDGNPYNNYSSRGNVNPYTGQLGSRDPSLLQPMQPLKPLGR